MQHCAVPVGVCLKSATHDATVHLLIRELIEYSMLNCEMVYTKRTSARERDEARDLDLEARGM